MSNRNPLYLTILLLNVLTTSFLTILSSVVTMIASNAIQGELALSNSLTIWLTTLNLLGINITVPIASWFADRFRYKSMYIIGVTLFSLASLIAGISTNFPILGIARVLEGVGGGFIFPVGLSLISKSFPPKRLPLALMLYITAIFGGGFAIGLPLAGYFTQFISWRAVFFLIVPFGILGIVSCAIQQEETEKIKGDKLDVFGFLAFSGLVCFLLLALTLAPLPTTTAGWESPYILFFLGAALCCLITLLFIERKHENPIIPLILFKDPIYALTCSAMFLLGMSVFGSASSMIEYMINALSYEKYVTGKIALIYGVSLTIFSLLSGFLIKKVPIPWLTFAGFCIIVYSYFLNNILDWQTGPSQISLILFLRGAGLGLALGPATTEAMKHVPETLIGKGASLLTFFRQVGSTYGGTLIALIIIKRKIFHAARFGEQANTQLPGFQVTFQKLFSYYSSNLSDKGHESSIRAKEAIFHNIEIQAFVQAINDALMVLGYITAVVALILASFSLRQWAIKRKQEI